MAKKEPSALKVGIIAGTVSTVIGGSILAFIPAGRIMARKAFTWGWSLVAGDFVIKGWYLGFLACLAVVGAVYLVFLVRPQPQGSMPDFLRYTEDIIHNVRWRWRYVGGRMDNLWCFCPHCDAQLVYNDNSCNYWAGGDARTDFICERCEQVMTSIKGGNKEYALAAVGREIDRRYRTGEYKRALPPLPAARD